METVLSDMSLYRFTGGSPPTKTELERRYAEQTRGHSRGDAEEWINYIVLVGSQGVPAGYVQATIPKNGEPAEIAWVIGKPWQGRRYARRAVALLVQELAGRGVRRVVAHIHPDHEASQRIAARLGMVPSGVVVEGEVRWDGDLTSSGADAPGSDIA